MFLQGFPGDFGERGPPGADGEPVSPTVPLPLNTIHTVGPMRNTYVRTACPSVKSVA